MANCLAIERRTESMENNATYLANKQDAEAGRAVYEAVNQEFERGYEINEALLMRILRDNSDTEYGRKYGFSEIASVEEYQKRVPVIVYDNIAEYIERMSNGEQNILTVYPFNHLNTTSATMGKKADSHDAGAVAGVRQV